MRAFLKLQRHARRGREDFTLRQVGGEGAAEPLDGRIAAVGDHAPLFEVKRRELRRFADEKQGAESPRFSNGRGTKEP